jgi:hypothetical protein
MTFAGSSSVKWTLKGLPYDTKLIRMSVTRHVANSYALFLHSVVLASELMIRRCRDTGLSIFYITCVNTKVKHQEIYLFTLEKNYEDKTYNTLAKAIENY